MCIEPNFQSAGCQPTSLSFLYYRNYVTSESINPVCVQPQTPVLDASKDLLQ